MTGEILIRFAQPSVRHYFPDNFDYRVESGDKFLHCVIDWLENRNGRSLPVCQNFRYVPSKEANGLTVCQKFRYAPSQEANGLKARQSIDNSEETGDASGGLAYFTIDPFRNTVFIEAKDALL